MSSRREDFLAERIDRRREHEQAREDRTARQKALAARASAFIACEIGEMPEDDRADYSECMATSVRAQLVVHHGPASAAAILGREAHHAARDILPRKIAQASAEQAFAKLQKPANDDRSEG